MSRKNLLPNRRRRRPRRGGYVLLIVMMLILTTTALSAAHQRHLSAALRVEQARVQSEQRIHGPIAVLAIACARLETGDPPSTISYRYSHTSEGVTTLYRIDYVSNSPQWIVTAEPDASAGALATLPDEF